MVIKASASAEIRALVEALAGADPVGREAAIARLAVIGPRAVDKLLTAFNQSAEPSVRATVLRALESIGDHHAAPAARQALGEGGDVAVAAIGVLRGLLDHSHGTVAADALDALVTLALNSQAERRVRSAALDALERMPDVRAKVSASVDVSDDVRADIGASGDSRDHASALWSEALEGRLPDDPELLRHALADRGGTAPLGSLRRMVDCIRRIEGESTGESTRDEWRAVRGAIHQILAARGSRVAVYDLRESLTPPTGKLPVSFLAALQAVGDATCLEPLAARIEHAASEGQWWQSQLAEAFRTIAKREKISRRHPVMRRISARWPQIPGRVLAKARPLSSS